MGVAGEVDRPQNLAVAVDACEAVDPHGRLLNLLLRPRPRAEIGRRSPGVVGLVVQHHDRRLSPDRRAPGGRTRRPIRARASPRRLRVLLGRKLVPVDDHDLHLPEEAASSAGDQVEARVQRFRRRGVEVRPCRASRSFTVKLGHTTRNASEKRRILPVGALVESRPGDASPSPVSCRPRWRASLPTGRTSSYCTGSIPGGGPPAPR